MLDHLRGFWRLPTSQRCGVFCHPLCLALGLCSCSFSVHGRRHLLKEWLGPPRTPWQKREGPLGAQDLHYPCREEWRAATGEGGLCLPGPQEVASNQSFQNQKAEELWHQRSRGPASGPTQSGLRRYHPLLPCEFNTTTSPDTEAGKTVCLFFLSHGRSSRACRSSDLTHFPIASAGR